MPSPTAYESSTLVIINLRVSFFLINLHSFGVLLKGEVVWVLEVTVCDGCLKRGGCLVWENWCASKVSCPCRSWFAGVLSKRCNLGKVCFVADAVCARIN
jgi:hypothetical protein